MFIEVVTLLRFEIPGGIGELEVTNLLTEANGDHKESRNKRDLLGWFLSPPLTGKIEAYKRASVPNQCLQGFLRFAKRDRGVFVTVTKVGFGQCLSRLSRCHALKN